MDRLLSGDVGFGKTEVAVRAAFKAIQDGKQVAMLVPTTLLVKQHLETFAERFAGFPVKVRALSRFQTDKQAREIAAGLADGTIDIVATDHAPHPAEAKSCEWQAAANGMVGLESALRVVQHAMVDTGLIGWEDVARVMSSAPARIGRLDGAGTDLVVGAPASLTLYDPSPTRVFTREDLRGRSTNSPYVGRELPGAVHWTFFRGTATVAEGAVVDLAEVSA